MNESVFKMIDTLHARLNDVKEAVESLSCEAPEYATKLDKIDDKLYLLQCEIEQRVAPNCSADGDETENRAAENGGAPEEGSSTVASTAAEEQDRSEGQSALCAEAKEGSYSSKSEDGGSNGAESDETLGQKKASNTSEGEKKEIFSDDMKENLADAGRAIGNIYRDGKEVITELSGTMGDLKDIFSFGKKR